MSEQEQEGKHQKQTGRPIGSLRQYATIGGVKHPDVQTADSPTIQNVAPSDVQTFSSPAAQTSKSPNVKKSRHPDWKQKTVYLPPEIVKWLNVLAAQEEREISEIVAQALEEYRDIHGA